MAYSFPLAASQFMAILPVRDMVFDIPEALETSELGSSEILTADLGTRLWQGEVTLDAGRYPEPEELWETKEAPQRTSADLEASDAYGRRSATLSLPSVPYGNQVQRLMRARVPIPRR